MTFSEILESAESLPIEDQEELVQTLRKRLSEQRRKEIVSATEEARKEFSAGTIKPVSADAITDSLKV